MHDDELYKVSRFLFDYFKKTFAKIHKGNTKLHKVFYDLFQKKITLAALQFTSL
jgi:hypothetical protein